MYNADRVAHRAELVEDIEAALRHDDAQRWARVLGEAGVPAGVVGDIGSAISLAENLGLAPVVELSSGSRQVRHPITYSVSDVRIPGEPPSLGEHDERVQTWLRESGSPAARFAQTTALLPDGGPDE